MASRILVVVKALIRYQGQCLVVQRAKGEFAGAGDWECPGGKLHFGEALEAGLQREVMEETGLSIRIDRLLCASTFFPHASLQCVQLNYLCQTDTDAITLSREHQAFRWVAKEDLPALLPQRIYEGIERML